MTAHVANRIRNGEEAICFNESLSSRAKRSCFGSLGLLGILCHFGSAKDHSKYLGSANDLKIVSGPAKDPINILIKQRSQ